MTSFPSTEGGLVTYTLRKDAHPEDPEGTDLSMDPKFDVDAHVSSSLSREERAWHLVMTRPRPRCANRVVKACDCLDRRRMVARANSFMVNVSFHIKDHRPLIRSSVELVLQSTTIQIYRSVRSGRRGEEEGRSWDGGGGGRENLSVEGYDVMAGRLIRKIVLIPTLDLGLLSHGPGLMASPCQLYLVSLIPYLNKINHPSHCTSGH